MTNQKHDLMDLARKFHYDLPDRIRQYLNARGISDELIEKHLLGWNGWRITIPIFDRAGNLAFFKQVGKEGSKTDGHLPKVNRLP